MNAMPWRVSFLGSFFLLLSLPLFAQDNPGKQHKPEGQDAAECERFQRIMKWLVHELEEEAKLKDDVREFREQWRMTPPQNDRFRRKLFGLLKRLRILETTLKANRHLRCARLAAILAGGKIPPLKEPEYNCSSCKRSDAGKRCKKCGKGLTKR